MKTIAQLFIAVLFVSTISMAQEATPTAKVPGAPSPAVVPSCPCTKGGYAALSSVTLSTPLVVSGNSLFDIVTMPIIPGACYNWTIKSLPSNTPLVSSHSTPFPTPNHFQFYGFDVPAGTTFINVRLVINCDNKSVTLTKDIKVIPCSTTIDPTFHYTITCGGAIPAGQYGLDFSYPAGGTHFYVIQETNSVWVPTTSTVQYVVGSSGPVTSYTGISPNLNLVFGNYYHIKHFVIVGGVMCCQSYNILLKVFTATECGTSARMSKGELRAMGSTMTLADAPAEILKMIPASIKNAQTETKVEEN